MDTEYNVKIKKVLKKLLDPDFKIKNDVYLTSLLTHLTDNPECGDNVNTTIDKQQIFAWLLEAVGQWEKVRKIPAPNILSFLLNLASFICRDEQTFVMLNSQNVFERLIKLLHVNEPATAPTIKLGYVKLVSSFLEHKSGLQWIISTNYWAEIMCLTLKNQTIYITKEGYRFLARLMDKSIKINEMFCYNVVQLIMAPLGKNAPCMPQNNTTNILEVRDQAIYQNLCSSLTLITEILEILLESVKEGSDMKVFTVFIEKFNLEQQIKNILLIAQNEEFIFDLYKILYVLAFFDLLQKFGGKGEYIDYEKAAQPGSKLYEILKENVNKGYMRNVIKLSYIGLIYWQHISSKMPICVRNGNCLPTLCEDQMLMLQLYPIISVSFRLLGEQAALKILEEDEVRDHYVNKIIKRVTPETMRLFFQWRSYLLTHPYIFDYATLALSYLIKSKQFFARDLAVTTFQTLIYCLGDVVKVLKEQPQEIVKLCKEYNYMTVMFDVITLFINEFNFNWRDSLESICVMSLAFDFLSLPTWSTKLVVKGLKLVDVSISKYMAPNMALLIDNVNDSTMGVIGPMLYAKLHDGSWEVRDTALEVLCTISHNAKEKFPSFSKILLDAELPSLILKMALMDGEAFVRATAVKCLQEMVQVEEFWEDLLKCGNIHEQVIRILQYDTEGIVRSQAATVITRIYEHQGIPPGTLGQFYDIMTHAATADLHWEVKVNALWFWEKVITCHLTHQGYIDGTFPKVTFSKEHRKIVNLNEVEVRNRLVKVLNQLSDTGCLAVLIDALQDDCDIEVAKTATKITKDFVELLKSYKIDNSNAKLSNPPSPLSPFNGLPSPLACSGVASTSGDSQYASMSPMSQNSLTDSPSMCHLDDMADSVLDEIINTQDINLLKGCYSPTDQPPSHCLKLRYRRLVAPNDFIKFTYTDLEMQVNKKTQWLNEIDDFGSLLDDILKEYDDKSDDVNSMDCY